eukprot:2673496-Pyramimonas_sp.AAC.1
MLRDPVTRVTSEFFWGRRFWCLDEHKHQAWPPALCRIANHGALTRGRKGSEVCAHDALITPNKCSITIRRHHWGVECILAVIGTGGP